jgi:hypothetical protein
VTGVAHGALDLKPDGSFTYRPAANYAGTDSFSYLASGGSTSSGAATVTITVAPAHCAPRSTVSVITVLVGGKLQATVEAVPIDERTNNRLYEVRFGTFQNGTVTISGQPIASGATYVVPGNSTKVTFIVEWATPGQPTSIPLTAVDECGPWPTFVGGGAAAGF